MQVHCEAETQADNPAEIQKTIRYYAVVVLGIPFLVLFLAIPISRSTWFVELPFGNKFLQNQARLLEHLNVGCDVIVFGDSTAITGVDPAILNERTGLKACNFSESIGVITVAGTTAIDTYLSHNKRPKYLVFQFAPENYVGHITSWKETIFTEGILQLVRDKFDGAGLLSLVRHPTETVEFLTWTWQMTFDGLNQKLIKHQGQWSGLHNGYFNATVEPQTSCQGNVIEDDVLKGRAVWNNRWMQEWQQRYAALGIDVLWSASPIPNCDAKFSAIADRLPKLDIPVEHYPISLYNDSDRHFDRVGSIKLSNRIADVLLKRSHG